MTAPRHAATVGNRRSVTAPFLLVICAFLVLNIVMLFAAVPDGALKFGADFGDYLETARAIIRHGAIVQIDAPSQPFTFRTPGFSIFMSGIIWVTGDQSVGLLIGLQIAMLLWVGLISRAIAEKYLPGYGDALMALVIFNPNALIAAHLVQIDTLSTLLFMLSIWFFFCYQSKGGVSLAWLTGLTLGLACLVRPTPQYLVLVLPLAFPLVAGLSGDWKRAGRHVFAGGFAVAGAIVVMAPWLLYMHSAGEGYSNTSAHYRYEAAFDTVLLLEQIESGANQRKAARIVLRREDQYRKSQGPRYPNMSAQDRHDDLTGYHLRSITQFPLSVLTKAAVVGITNMFAGGGATNYHQLFGLKHRSSWEIMATSPDVNFLAASLESFNYSSPLAIVASIVAIGFAVVMRIIGMIGLVALIRRRDWALLMLLASVFGYFLLIHVFNSSARYRLPIEPLLLLLALFGFDKIRSWRQQGRNRQQSDTEAITL
jgi:4-amino-4-deoxy-L-arabinose transferase-like glycosyltransferase